MNNQTLSMAKKYTLLIIASFLLYFTGLRYSFFLAPWISIAIFVFFFREKNRWYEYIIIYFLLTLPKFLSLHKGWDMSIWLEFVAVTFISIPLVTALLLDKHIGKRLSVILSTLVFPSTYVVLDWLIGKSPFGTFSSIALTQFNFKSLLQLASVTGMEGIAFVVLYIKYPEMQNSKNSRYYSGT